MSKNYDQDEAKIKAYFQTGDKPNQAQFEELIEFANGKDLDAKIDQQKIDLEKKISDEDAVLDAKIDQQKIDLEKKISDEDAVLDAKIDQQKIDLEKKISDEDAVLDAKIDQQKIDLEKKISDEDAVLDGKIDQQKIDLEKKISDEDAVLDAKIDQQKIDVLKKVEKTGNYSSGDFNTIINTGVYTVNNVRVSAFQNAPTSQNGGWWITMYAILQVATSGSRIVQTLSDTSGRRAQRVCDNPRGTAWGVWKQLHK